MITLPTHYLVDEYDKRLGAYTKTELIEVADEKAPDNMSEKDIEIVKEGHFTERQGVVAAL